MSSATYGAASNGPVLPFDPRLLPIAQLESLKFRANQIIESIQSLQRTLDAGGQNVMPAWPDILSKYNILLSQTHSFSSSLAGGLTADGSKQGLENPYEKLALHPSTGMSDTQLDNDTIPLLRNQQTTDVLRQENETVRRLSEHTNSKGSLGVLLPGVSNPTSFDKLDYTAVLAECEQIKVEHDQRVERAIRAVNMLRDKYDWKARVAVDQEEPDELDWDPRMQGNDGTQTHPGEGVAMNTPDTASSEDDEEMEMEDVLGEITGTPDGTDGGGTGPAGFGTPVADPFPGQT